MTTPQPLEVMEALEPCPFCGQPARIDEGPCCSSALPRFALEVEHLEICPLVHVMDYVPMFFTKAEAIAAWNTRPLSSQGSTPEADGEVVERVA